MTIPVRGSENRTPFIDPSIPAWLASIYPDTTPDEGMTGRQIWMAVGEQRVVRKLKALADSQQKNILNTVL
jgi:hypothetical protein